MNKVGLLLIFLIILTSSVFAQQEPTKLSYKLYGFVRTDFCYDSRQGASANEGLFYLYPLDIKPDDSDAHKDLNATPSSGFYAFNTRFGLDITGLKVFDADVLARVEADFAGYSNSSTLLRIRRAFMKMQWENSSLLIGQEWHPMFGGVVPSVLSLNTGAPFNPFNRSPQINYSYKFGNVTLIAAALWQFQYTSIGPEGKKPNYQRNSNVPEFSAAIDFKRNGIVFGAMADYLTLQPRTQFISENKTYKVTEQHLTSFSYGAYVGYSHNLFSVNIKSVLGENMANLSMPGGFGVSKIDPVTGQQEYTNFKHSTSWLNFVYGKKYQGSLFAGYTKNLGSQDKLALTDANNLASTVVYGDGMNMNELYRFCGIFSYNVPNFTIGLEYEFTTSVYGEGARNVTDGLFEKTHDVSGHRILGVISYNF